MQEQIDKDIKDALLSGDKKKAEALRTIKSALLNEAISQNVRDKGLSDDEAQKVLAREAKKRAEAADLYQKAGETERAEAEMAEKAIIESYLPEQLDEAEIAKAVNEEIEKLSASSPADMGKVIGAVRARLGAGADGATIARLAKERLK